MATPATAEKAIPRPEAPGPLALVAVERTPLVRLRMRWWMAIVAWLGVAVIALAERQGGVARVCGTGLGEQSACVDVPADEVWRTLAR